MEVALEIDGRTLKQDRRDETAARVEHGLKSAVMAG